jgi:hypothetical protein
VRPAQQFMVKMLIGLVALSALTSATYLVAVLALWVLPSNYTASALSAGVFFFAGFVCWVSWTKRQIDEWWGQ